VQAGRSTGEISLSLSRSYPEVLPHLQSPVAIKEELEHAGSIKEEGITTARKEKSKKKHKSGLDITGTLQWALLINFKLQLS